LSYFSAHTKREELSHQYKKCIKKRVEDVSLSGGVIGIEFVETEQMSLANRLLSVVHFFVAIGTP
jgi:hypothetical protein